MEFIVGIYVISMIGVILSIRYDDNFFVEKPATLVTVFFPVINTVICLLELCCVFGTLADKIAALELDKKFYELIRLGRKENELLR